MPMPPPGQSPGPQPSSGVSSSGVAVYGIPSQTQLHTYTDSLATVVKNFASQFGLGSSGESGTLAIQLQNAIVTLAGDGTSTNPGLGNVQFQNALHSAHANTLHLGRADYFLNRMFSKMVTSLEAHIASSLIPGVNLTPHNGANHVLDGWLLRVNGAHSGVPTTPAAATLTAVNVNGGGLTTVSASLAPRVTYTLVGTYDYDESLPSPEFSQVAISGTSNAYTFTPAGNVPSGVTKVRVYRGMAAQTTGLYYWDQDVTVTAGQPFPLITVMNPDSSLRLDWIPPSWLSSMHSPEFAAIFALAFSTAIPAYGARSNPLSYSSTGMLNPSNVFATPANSFLGIGNSAQSATLGSTVIGTGFSAGTLQTANNYALNSQGFGGAMSLRVRVTTSPNGTATPTISYTYYDAAHGYGNVQTATGVALPSAIASGAAVGSTVAFTIPAGRIILSVTETSLSATATTGAYLYEPDYPRSY